MLELIALLRAADFKIFIVSGGGIEFMQTFSASIFRDAGMGDKRA